MVEYNLDSKVKKAVLNIEQKVMDIDNVLRDLSMKLCHIIREKRDQYDIYRDMLEGVTGLVKMYQIWPCKNALYV